MNEKRQRFEKKSMLKLVKNPRWRKECKQTQGEFILLKNSVFIQFYQNFKQNDIIKVHKYHIICPKSSKYFKFGTILRSTQNVGVASITNDRFPYYGIFES